MVDRFEKFSLAISEISRYRHKIATDDYFDTFSIPYVFKMNSTIEKQNL